MQSKVHNLTTHREKNELEINSYLIDDITLIYFISKPTSLLDEPPFTFFLRKVEDNV